MASTKISDHVYKLCTTPESVSSLLAQDPKLSPGEAAKRLYHPEGIRISEPGLPKSRTPASAEELQRAYECGKWGPTKPSELFLRIFHDSLLPLNHDPLMGCCSPSLVGSCGAVPLTVLAPLEDICRHMVRLSESQMCCHANVYSPTSSQERTRRSSSLPTTGLPVTLLHLSQMP